MCSWSGPWQTTCNSTHTSRPLLTGNTITIYPIDTLNMVEATTQIDWVHFLTGLLILGTRFRCVSTHYHQKMLNRPAQIGLKIAEEIFANATRHVSVDANTGKDNGSDSSDSEDGNDDDFWAWWGRRFRGLPTYMNYFEAWIHAHVCFYATTMPTLGRCGAIDIHPAAEILLTGSLQNIFWQPPEFIRQRVWAWRARESSRGRVEISAPSKTDDFVEALRSRTSAPVGLGSYMTLGSTREHMRWRLIRRHEASRATWCSRMLPRNSSFAWDISSM